MGLIRRTPSPTRTDPALIAELRRLGKDWTPEAVRALIRATSIPDAYPWTLARFIARHPGSAVVSDEEFLAAAHVVDPACAREFATPEGVAFLHRLSRSAAGRLPLVLLGIDPGGET